MRSEDAGFVGMSSRCIYAHGICDLAFCDLAVCDLAVFEQAELLLRRLATSYHPSSPGPLVPSMWSLNERPQ